MGKTDNEKCDTGDGVGRSTLSGDEITPLKEGMKTIRGWERFLPPEGTGSITSNIRAKAKALGVLSRDADAQRELIKIAQEATALIDKLIGEDPRHPMLAQAKQINKRARSLVMICNNSLVEEDIRKVMSLLKGEMSDDAMDIMRQEAFMGISRGIDSYDLAAANRPITYFRQGQIRNYLKKCIQREGQELGVRLKSDKTEDAKKIDRYINEIQSEEGRKPTLAEISDHVKMKPDDVAELLPFIGNPAVRMDAPIKTSEGFGSTVGELMEDTAPGVEEAVVANDYQHRVRQAVSDIESPLIRTTISMLYGIDRDPVQQSDLYEGVYKDEEGNLFSSERSIIKKRKSELGEEVEYRSQVVLNQGFDEEKLVFVPGTQEAYELARMTNDDFDPGEKYQDEIRKEIGVPLTAGKIYEIKVKAEKILREDPRLKDLSETYRGENEIEESETARQKIREELLRRGRIDSTTRRDLQSSKSSSGGKSKLRLLAEEENLVDEDGRVIREVINI